MKVYPLSEKQINIIFIVIFTVVFTFFCISILLSLQILFINDMEFASFLLRMAYKIPAPLSKGLINLAEQIFTGKINETFKSEVLLKNSMFFIVILGFILIILNNIDILKSVIKNFSLNRISKFVREKETVIEKPVTFPLYLNIFFIVFSILLFVLFYHQYFSHTVYILYESYTTLPLQMKEGSEILKQCIPTIFNLDNYEGGSYRPRVLSFLVDYININALPVLNRLFPFWGMRLFITVLAIFLSVAAMYILLNDFIKAMPVGIKLFLSVFPIYFVNYQPMLPFFYRTSKYLVIPLGLFILRYFYKNYDISFTKKGIPTGLLAWILLSLSTLYDEQLVAIVVFFFCLSLLYSLIEKKLYMNTVVFAASVVFYLFWYFCLGRNLFSVYTPHPLFAYHSGKYSTFLTIFYPEKVYEAVIFYYNLISNNFKILLPMLFILLGFSLVNRNIERKAKMCLIVIPVLSLSFLLTCAIIFGSPQLFRRYFFNIFYYFTSVIYLVYFVSIYFTFNILRFLPYKKIFAGIIFLFLLTTIIDNHYRKDEYYSALMKTKTTSGYFLPLNTGGVYQYVHKRFDDIIKEKNIDQKYLHTYVDYSDYGNNAKRYF